MAGLKSSSGGLAWDYIILNACRFFNIAALLIVAASSGVLMVVAKMPNAFVFFNDISLFFIITVCLLLICSEIGQLPSFFRDYWPVFADPHGFVYLGLAMLILGSHTLGQLSDGRNSPSNMPSQFWALCLAGGIISIFMGIANIFTSWFFGKRLGLSARELRIGGATVDKTIYTDTSSYGGGSVRKEKGKSFFDRFGHGSKKPTISEPVAQDLEQGYDSEGCPIDSRASPVVPGLQRPPTALHPALGRPSHYSVATEARFI